MPTMLSTATVAGLRRGILSGAMPEHANPPPVQSRDDAPGPSDEARLVVEFLRERDAACPECGYNLRNLTSPVCPECRRELHLSIAPGHRSVTGLLITAVPGAFSGVAAVLLLIPVLLLGPPRSPESLGVGLLIGFGLLSGVSVVVLGMRADRFLCLNSSGQATVAIIVWSVHVLAFVVLLAWLNGL